MPAVAQIPAHSLRGRLVAATDQRLLLLTFKWPLGPHRCDPPVAYDQVESVSGPVESGPFTTKLTLTVSGRKVALDAYPRDRALEIPEAQRAGLGSVHEQRTPTYADSGLRGIGLRGRLRWLRGALFVTWLVLLVASLVVGGGTGTALLGLSLASVLLGELLVHWVRRRSSDG